jgi:hypothetical protein
MSQRMQGSAIGLAILALWPGPGGLGLRSTAAQDQQRTAQGRIARGDLLPVDATMFGLAAATGGDFYFWSPGEFAEAAGRLRIPLGGEALLLSYEDLGNAGTRSFRIPVDGAVERLELFAGAQRLDRLRITRPSGLTAGELDAGVDWQRFERMQIVGIERPEPGPWLVEIGAAGRTTLTTHVRVPSSRRSALAPEPIECIDFDFVARAGRPGHEGAMPLERPPAPGEEALLEIDLSGKLRDVEVQLVDLAGASLAPPVLPLPGIEGEELHVPIVVPAVSFRVLVRGFDPAGLAVQRVFASSVDPTPEPPPALDMLPKD